MRRLRAHPDAVDAEGEPLEGFVSLREELVGVPEASGLFARVDHQQGFEGFRAEADYTLDFALYESVGTGWYTGLGLIPGVPLIGHWLWTLECGVLDRRREVLGKVEVAREGTVIAWSVFLPFNLLLTPLPGSWFGFDLLAIAEDQRAMVDGMIKDALALAEARFGFTARE